jgi:hypothetical protein
VSAPAGKMKPLRDMAGSADKKNIEEQLRLNVPAASTFEHLVQHFFPQYHGNNQQSEVKNGADSQTSPRALNALLREGGSNVHPGAADDAVSRAPHTHPQAAPPRHPSDAYSHVRIPPATSLQYRVRTSSFPQGVSRHRPELQPLQQLHMPDQTGIKSSRQPMVFQLMLGCAMYLMRRYVPPSELVLCCQARAHYQNSFFKRILYNCIWKTTPKGVYPQSHACNADLEEPTGSVHMQALSTQVGEVHA